MNTTAQRVMARFLKAELAGAWNSWVDTVRSMRGLRRMMTRMMNQQIIQAFDGWAEWVEEAKRMNTVCSRILTRMLNAQLAGAFSAWAEHVHEQARMQAVCARVLKRMTQAQLVGAWNGWCDIIAEKRARTAAATKVLTRMINSALTAALNTWIEVVVEVRLLRRYHSRQRIYVQRAALRGWVQAITEQKELRENVRKMVNRTEQQAVGVTYRRWISSMYEGREDRAAEREEQVRECALARFVLRKQMAAVADCLRAWDELIASRRRRRALGVRLLSVAMRKARARCVLRPSDLPCPSPLLNAVPDAPQGFPRLGTRACCGAGQQDARSEPGDHEGQQHVHADAPSPRRKRGGGELHFLLPCTPIPTPVLGMLRLTQRLVPMSVPPHVVLLVGYG